MKLHDTHCHLDLYDRPQDMAAEIEALGIRTIAVTNAPSVFKRSSQLTEKRRFLRTALGFHPELAASRRNELPLFRELAPEARYIGEVGLDYTSRDEVERRLQREVFAAVLDSCAGSSKLMTVHSRRAVEPAIDMIGTGLGATVVLHWYSGSLRAIERAAAVGLWFSVNAAMVRSSSGKRVVAALPRNHVLLESDGPFVRVGGRPAGPADGESVVAGIAGVWGLATEEVARLLHGNLRAALGADSLGLRDEGEGRPS